MSIQREIDSSGVQLMLRRQDVAKLMDVSLSTVNTLIYSGALTSVKIGRSRRVRRADLDRYIASLRPAESAESAA